MKIQQNQRVSTIEFLPNKISMLGVLFATLSTVCLLSAWKWLEEEYITLRFVRIEGAFQHINPSDIEDTVLPVLANGYASIDLSRVVRDAAMLPWVDRVQAERIWPDTLILRVEEHSPYLRWGNEALLSADGVRFDPSESEPFRELPAIFAADGMEARLFRIMKKMQKDLESYGLRIALLEVNDREAWTVRLDGGLELKLGRRRPIDNFDRFLGSLPILGKQRLDAIRRIDLRYPNGYAVAVKPNSVIQWESESV